MKQLIFDNGRETIDLINDEFVRLISSDGMSAEAIINTQSVNGVDGSSVVSMQTPMRNPMFTLRFRGGDVEAQQIRLNRIFKPKISGTMTVVAEHGQVKLDYVVEKLSIPPNAFPLQASVSLLCPNPFFYSPKNNNVVVAGVKSRFVLPFQFPAGEFKISEATQSAFCAITNNGEADTGIVIKFSADAAVTNPMLIDVTTGNTAKINYEMQAGHVITITTEKRNKTVMLTRNEEQINLFNYRAYPFTFLQLPTGTSLFKYDADEGVQSLRVNVTFTEKYTSCYTEGQT